MGHLAIAGLLTQYMVWRKCGWNMDIQQGTAACRFVLFGGSRAGESALSALSGALGDRLRALVWDETFGEPPSGYDIPVITAETAHEYGDVLLCSGYGKILSAELLARFPRGAFNAHPSLLPEYRGRHAIQWAIANGETRFGVSVHHMTRQIDVGGVVAVSEVFFGIETRLLDVSIALAELASTMLVELAVSIDEGRLTPGTRCNDAPYWRRRTPEDSRIDWSKPGKVVIDTVRAAGESYPAFSATSDGTPVMFPDYLAGNRPGTVLLSTPEGCLIAVVDGVVWLTPDRALKKGDLLE